MSETITDVFNAALLEICGPAGISPVAVTDTRNRSRKVTAARRLIINRMCDAGFNHKSIAILMNIHLSGVNYHYYAKLRTRSLARRKASHEAARA